MTPRRIAFVPFAKINRDNAYPFRMRAILERFGSVEEFDGVKKSVLRCLSFRRRRYDAIIVNWVENDIIDAVTKRLSIKAIAKLFAKALLMRLGARRTIFVRHNNYPHATTAGEVRSARRWIDAFEALHQRVITHSGAAVTDRRHYVPHPLYTRVTPSSVADASLPHDYFVAFGMMLPYKRLAELIEAFPDDRNLVVIGAIGDAQYATRLVGMQRANIFVRPGFLAEEDAQRIVSRATALLLVHADPNVVVSGSFFYAMSLPVPVIAIETPFLRWVTTRVGTDLLSTATDIDDVCRQAKARSARESTPAQSSVLEREFGDEVIVKALEAILWKPSKVPTPSTC